MPKPTDNKQKIYDYFKNKGLKHHQIIGILANLQQESQFNPKISTTDKPYGLAQWRGTRKDELLKIKNYDTLSVQLDFMWNELQTTEKSAFNKLKKATNSEEATTVFNNNFERSDNVNTPEIEGDPDKRLANAKKLDSFNFNTINDIENSQVYLDKKKELEKEYGIKHSNILFNDKTSNSATKSKVEKKLKAFKEDIYKKFTDKYQELSKAYKDNPTEGSGSTQQALIDFTKENEKLYGNNIFKEAEKYNNDKINAENKPLLDLSTKIKSIDDKIKDKELEIQKNDLTGNTSKGASLKKELKKLQKNKDSFIYKLQTDIHKIEYAKLSKQIKNYKGDINSTEFKDLKNKYKSLFPIKDDIVKNFFDDVNSRKVTLTPIKQPQKVVTATPTKQPTKLVENPNGAVSKTNDNGEPKGFVFDPRSSLSKQEQIDAYNVYNGDKPGVISLPVNDKGEPLDENGNVINGDSGYDKTKNAFDTFFDDPNAFQKTPTAKDQEKKKGILNKIPLDAIGSGALGILALSQADQELPLRDEEVSQSVLNFIADTKRLSEQGLRPEEELQAKQFLNSAYQSGLNSIVKASGGNRNLVLGNLSKLNKSRLEGLTNIAIADAKAREKGLQDYGKAVQYLDSFYQNRSVANHAIRLQEAKDKRMAAGQLANSAFSGMIDSINEAKQNAPGTMNYALRQFMMEKVNRSKANREIAIHEHNDLVDKRLNLKNNFGKVSENAQNEITKILDGDIYDAKKVNKANSVLNQSLANIYQKQNPKPSVQSLSPVNDRPQTSINNVLGLPNVDTERPLSIDTPNSNLLLTPNNQNTQANVLMSNQFAKQ